MPCVYLPGPAPAVTVANNMYYGIKMTKRIKWQKVDNGKRYKIAKRLKWQNVINDKTY
jgi:hypothetical protein